MSAGSSSPRTPYHRGMVVTLVGLTQRADLDGSTATLKRFCEQRQQWRLKLQDGTHAFLPATKLTQLQAGMDVTLVGHSAQRPDLSFSPGTLVDYSRDRQRWRVQLPTGERVFIPGESLMTRSMLAQPQYERFGYPKLGQPCFAELVEEGRGEHGRYLVARRAVAMGTYAKHDMVRLTMTDEESQAIFDAYDAFAAETVPRLLGTDTPHPELDPRCSPMCIFMGMFMCEEVLQHPMVQDLMHFDSLDAAYLADAMGNLNITDVLLFEYWRTTLAERFEADLVWRSLTFLLSHGFCDDEQTLTFGPFCKAQCPEQRWQSYQLSDAPPIAVTLGNIEVVPPWSRQANVRSDEIPGDQCVFFSANVSQGEPVTFDYGPNYKMSPELQLRQYRDHELRPLLEAVLGRLDPRVLQALHAHMDS